MYGDCKKVNAVYSHFFVTSAVERQPQDVWVDAGKRAHFFCVTNNVSVVWRVDGTNLDDLPSGTLKDEAVQNESILNGKGDRIFTLSFLGRAIYNGTEVQCVADDGEFSNVATLVVKGIISIAVMWSCV